jgi:hypothetical protein
MPKLEMEDIKGELVTVTLATSYAPVGNAKEHIRHLSQKIWNI